MSQTVINGDVGSFGIAPYSMAKLTRAFERSPGVERVWIFGSRARGDYRRESDIDLAVDAVSENAYSHVSRAVEALELIYRVDLIDLQNVSDTEFLTRIEQEKKLFWEPRAYPADTSGLFGTNLK